jgi:hypothetical protein
MWYQKLVPQTSISGICRFSAGVCGQTGSGAECLLQVGNQVVGVFQPH